MRPLILLLLTGLFHGAAFSQQTIPVIPAPNEMTVAAGNFTFTPQTHIVCSKALENAIQPLVTKFKTAAGYDLINGPGKNHPADVLVQLDSSIGNTEGYSLEVGVTRISLKARSAAGAFYGVQTLLQLLPAAIEKKELSNNVLWTLPCVSIRDQPRFGYRGVMLDVARHYMPLDFIRKLIDLLAMQKMNRLHLHLTDSQGWRFESKKYPNLIKVGAFRKGTPLNTTYDFASRPADTVYGGYYTQLQLRELVRYAQKRYITIVPELEMPSHSQAALASYPDLACLDSNGKKFAYPQDIQNEFCTKDATFTFLENILVEIMDVFPSRYIHVAGDEASKQNWKKCIYCQRRMKQEGLQNVEELQSYFIKRIERFVNSRGRQIIGWDEILQGGLAPNAAVMSWTGIEGGIKAAHLHHQVIITPGAFCYLDHYQSDAPGEPVAIGGYLPLSTVYGYDPVPASLPEGEKSYIQGTQGNLWTEYIPGPAKAEYMIFPRAVALAEVAWTQPAKKKFEDFIARLDQYCKRLDAYQVNYSRHLFEIKLLTARDQQGRILASVEGVAPGREVRYTLDGTTPTANADILRGSLAIDNDKTLSVAVLTEGKVTDQIAKTFRLHKAVGRKIQLATEPDAQYSRGGSHALVDGILGNNEHFEDDQWLGWEGKTFEGTIDFESPASTSSLQTRFFHKPTSWLWAPKSVTVQVSDDNLNFRTVAKTEISAPALEGPMAFSISWTPVMARYLKVIVEPVGIIPAGAIGAGDLGWLFVDEVVIE